MMNGSVRSNFVNTNVQVLYFVYHSIRINQITIIRTDHIHEIWETYNNATMCTKLNECVNSYTYLYLCIVKIIRENAPI